MDRTVRPTPRVAPLIATAQRLRPLGRPFEVHYALRSRSSAGFRADIETAPWRAWASPHAGEEGTRADLGRLVPGCECGSQLYTCGGARRFMDAVLGDARARGSPDEALHREYFAVPEPPDYVNHPFLPRLASSGRAIEVGADESATEAPAAAGTGVETKCSDGIRAVRATPYSGGAVEHRDYVLSAREREREIILRRSRAKQPGGEVGVEL